MRNARRCPSVLALLLAGACVGGRADDDVLGLPAPRDAAHPGAVMLHGGGRLRPIVYDRFVELAGARAARIVVVPSAGYRQGALDGGAKSQAALNRRFGSWVRLERDGRVASFEFLHTDEPADADDESFVRPLERATGVWFSGGSQSRLNARYVGQFPRRTRFQTALRGVLERGGVVGGTSAGMAALPEIMTLYQVRPKADAPALAVAAHGLGLFDGAIVEQHFDRQAGRLERFTGLLRDPRRLDDLAGRAGAAERMLGLAVEDSAALVLRPGWLEAIGSHDCHVFVRSPDGRALAWHTLKPGDRFRLRREPRGPILLDPER